MSPRMRVSLVVALVAVATCMLAAAPAQADATGSTGPHPGQIRVLSYNIHHAAGTDGVLDLERIAQVIETSGADVIGLQEVDRHWSARSDWVDQAAWLAERLGMHYAYGANLDLDPVDGDTQRRQYGTAILSKYPIISATNHLLTNIEYAERPTEQRGLLHAVITVRGAMIDVYNTHLDHQRAEQRISQVHEILDIVQQRSGTAVVVGDLNAQPDVSEVQMLTAVMADAFAGIANSETHPAEAPDARIDYILVRDGLGVHDQQVMISDGSDHLPIAATVAFQRPQR